MERGKISKRQLFILMLLFELGSSIVINLGMQAKQDAWLAVLLGTGAGVCLFLVYDYLYHQYEGLPLTQYVRSILGKYLGSLLALLYIFYFFYLSARVLRDFGDLLLTSTLEATPMLVINSMLMLVIGGAVYYGLEVVGRTGEIILPFMIFLALITGVAILFSHIFHIKNLLPVLEGGWKPVMKATFPLTVTFPFGEIIVFSMILPYVNEQAHTRKTGVKAILISGFILITTIITNIAVLGVAQASTEQFPLLTTVGKINVGDFIQRIDAVALSALILGGFFKISIFFYAGINGMKDLFLIQKKKHILILVASFIAVVTVYSVNMDSSFTSHIEIGLKQVPYYLHIPFQIGIPVLLLVITWGKKLGKKPSPGRIT